MTADRFVVFGLAQARSPWFSEVSRWANAGSIPVDFVKCVSAEEVRARFDAGRAVSALITDASRVAGDRDLIDRARRGGAAVLVVDDGRVTREWRALGVAAVLPPAFGRNDLVDALTAFATPIGRVELQTLERSLQIDTPWRGYLVAVTGPGGTGASTIAMALAQALGSDARNRGLVLLADLSLAADLAMFHDARDVVPGLQELVDACRSGVPLDDLGDVVYHISDRGYDLLLGLRRHRDWTAIRPRSFDVALDAVRRRYRVVVGDVDADVEGEEDTGSIDVSERNHIARSTLRNADAVLVVGLPGTKGMHALVRTMHQLASAGVDASRCIPVLNRLGRSPRVRADLARSYAALRGVDAHALAAPIFVAERRRLDDTVAQAAPLPAGWCQPLAKVVAATLDRMPRPAAITDAEPVAVVPGSLGSWSDEADGAA